MIESKGLVALIGETTLYASDLYVEAEEVVAQ
jgi:hypothetical protein